ncbi:response regulator transcription factor [Sphingobacterium alkalisoli]|uniref:Response regulator transcription factor n=1 Tax=Sphingobacterium alkalisoli TaxID=1874115 RepID=A0A4U0H471_9SPHI|nr:response regulator transcription factor [Sphingobacterium alkalisoli]TJY66483.1 response regulator transcription factor [Sphingobacterium alkalisoli]GGH16134.1 DNA-binding response regulator [Sphingobacterium alkalisoli]
MKILIIEDEIDLLHSVQEFLEQESYLVEFATNYETAVVKVLSYQYDCILLDIMLPGGSGLDILRLLKNEKKDQPVLILSAKDSVEDKVLGLEIGADDYLAKPFHLSELLARIKSIVRRHMHQGDHVISYKDVKLNPDLRQVTVGSKEVILNRKEYDMLYYLMLRPNKLMEKTTIAETVWGDNADQADNLDFIYSQIKNLRRKLKEANAQIDIQAVYGVGYKLI